MPRPSIPLAPFPPFPDPPFSPLETTPFTLVDSEEGLATMVKELRGARHVAIDLEAHSYRCVFGGGA